MMIEFGLFMEHSVSAPTNPLTRTDIDSHERPMFAVFLAGFYSIWLVFCLQLY